MNGGAPVVAFPFTRPCPVLLGVQGIIHDSVSLYAKSSGESGGLAKVLVDSLAVERVTIFSLGQRTIISVLLRH